MDSLSVSLDGIATEIRRLKIDLKQLILDIENPRIQYFFDTRLNDNIWRSIDAYVLPYKVNRNVINFIRLEKHLFGPTPWDAYEKARELYRLNTEEDYSLRRLEQLTKLTASDMKNNIQAFMNRGEHCV